MVIFGNRWFFVGLWLAILVKRLWTLHRECNQPSFRWRCVWWDQHSQRRPANAQEIRDRIFTIYYTHIQVTCVYKNIHQQSKNTYIYIYIPTNTPQKKTITTNAKTPIEIMFSCTHGLCPMLNICHCVKHKDIPLESHQGRNWKHGISSIDLDHGHINASPKKPHQRRRTLSMCIVCHIKGTVHIETKKNKHI